MYIYTYMYMLCNMLQVYKQGHYHSQLFPPSLLHCEPQLLHTYVLLMQFQVWARRRHMQPAASGHFTIQTHSDGQTLNFREQLYSCQGIYISFSTTPVLLLFCFSCIKHLYRYYQEWHIHLPCVYLRFEVPNCQRGVHIRVGVSRRLRQSASMMRAARTPILCMRGVSISQLQLGLENLNLIKGGSLLGQPEISTRSSYIPCCYLLYYYLFI